jgi:hypothetical protein
VSIDHQLIEANNMPKYNVSEEFMQELNTERLELASLMNDSELFRNRSGAREALRGIQAIGDAMSGAIVHTPLMEIRTGLDRNPPPIPEEGSEPPSLPTPEQPGTPVIPLDPIGPPNKGLSPEDFDSMWSTMDNLTPEEFATQYVNTELGIGVTIKENRVTSEGLIATPEHAMKGGL